MPDTVPMSIDAFIAMCRAASPDCKRLDPVKNDARPWVSWKGMEWPVKCPRLPKNWRKGR